MVDFWAILTGGFALGLLGSLHCVAMCGPIALALPFGKLKTQKQYFFTILYTLGRISSYAILGLICGFLGAQFFSSGLQQILAIVVGFALILHLVYKVFKKQDSLFDSYIQKWTGKVTQPLGKLLRSNNPAFVMSAGFLNGLLPCGLVYLASVSSLLMPSTTKGMAFMAAFGAGTAPALFAVLLLASKFRANFKMKRIVPILTIAMAVLFILRGMELGIPYLSPIFQAGVDGMGCE